MNTQDNIVWFSNLIISGQPKLQHAICSPGHWGHPSRSLVGLDLARNGVILHWALLLIKYVAVSQTSLRKGMKSCPPASENVLPPSKSWEPGRGTHVYLSSFHKQFLLFVWLWTTRGRGWAGFYPLLYSPPYLALSFVIGRTQCFLNGNEIATNL